MEREAWREGSASSVETGLVADDPRPGVRRLTLDRPDVRNALSARLVGEILTGLEVADADPFVGAVVVRGAGPSFCSGYDLKQDPTAPWPVPAAAVDGQRQRIKVAVWARVWDLATPVVAQVHGYCLAGGTELAAACDLVYVADDAVIGYPVVRDWSTPDLLWQPWLLGHRKAMELLLTGDPMTGKEAAESGFANASVPVADLDELVLDTAERIAASPRADTTLVKRSVHRSAEVTGLRSATRATADLSVLGLHQPGSRGQTRATVSR